MRIRNSLRFIVSLLLVAIASIPAFAATYSTDIVAAFGTSKTGLSASVLYTVIDSGGTVRIASTGTGVTEETDAASNSVTGTYRASVTLDTSWNYPLRVKWTITGQAGVTAVAIIGFDRTVLANDGYNAVTAQKMGQLPNVAAGTSGGLPLAGTGGAVVANTTQLAGQTVTAPTGVTFPASISSYAGGDTSGVTTLLGRIPTFPTNFSSMAIASGTGYVSSIMMSLDSTLQSTIVNAIWAKTIDGTLRADNALAMTKSFLGGDYTVDYSVANQITVNFKRNGSSVTIHSTTTTQSGGKTNARTSTTGTVPN